MAACCDNDFTSCAGLRRKCGERVRPLKGRRRTWCTLSSRCFLLTGAASARRASVIQRATNSTSSCTEIIRKFSTTRNCCRTEPKLRRTFSRGSRRGEYIPAPFFRIFVVPQSVNCLRTIRFRRLRGVMSRVTSTTMDLHPRRSFIDSSISVGKTFFNIRRYMLSILLPLEFTVLFVPLFFSKTYSPSHPFSSHIQEMPAVFSIYHKLYKLRENWP